MFWNDVETKEYNFGFSNDKNKCIANLSPKEINIDNELNEISTTEDFSVVQQESSREVCRTVKN